MFCIWILFVDRIIDLLSFENLHLDCIFLTKLFMNGIYNKTAQRQASFSCRGVCGDEKAKIKKDFSAGVSSVMMVSFAIFLRNSVRLSLTLSLKVGICSNGIVSISSKTSITSVEVFEDIGGMGTWERVWIVIPACLARWNNVLMVIQLPCAFRHEVNCLSVSS